MAGFTDNKVVGGDYSFHIDTPNVAERIRHANNMSPVITLQLDGDELDAALWGLENYTKPGTMRCDHLSRCGKPHLIGGTQELRPVAGA